MHIPEGAWYCPECRINELEPKLKSGTTLKGAKLFGVDSYGQIFLGACGHLLVLKALSGSNSIFRYYNEKDIPIVMRALNSNVQHGTLYLEICKGIMQYWKIHVNVLHHNGEPAEIGSQRPDGTRYTISSTHSLNSLVKGSLERENTGSCATEVNSENASLSNFSKEPMLDEISGVVSQPNDIHQVKSDFMAGPTNAPKDLLPSGKVEVKYVE